MPSPRSPDNDVDVGVGVATAALLMETSYVAVFVVVPAPAWVTVADTETPTKHGVVGVPLIVPVTGLIESPAGSPLADHETVTSLLAATVAA